MKKQQQSSTVMSKLHEIEREWTPEEGSRAYYDMVPVREPMAVTMMRVGGDLPEFDRASFAVLKSNYRDRQKK